MKITSTDKKVSIELKNETNTYPLNYLGYQKTDNGITLFRGREITYTAPISQIIVDGTQATHDNIDELLEPLFKLGSGGGGDITLPINISDVSGLTAALAARPADWVGTTFYVDGRYTADDSTGSPLKPFKTIQAAHDAFVPINDYDSVKIVYSPYAYYTEQDTLTFTKNVSLIGVEDTNQYDCVVGNINVKPGCTQLHLDNVFSLGLNLDNPVCLFTSNYFRSYTEVNIVNAKRAWFRDFRIIEKKLIVTNCEEVEIHDSHRLIVEVNSGKFAAYGCTFGWSYATWKMLDALVMKGTSTQAVLINCNFANFSIAPNKYMYHAISNPANAVIAVFDSVIGDANKSVNNVKYIDNSVDVTRSWVIEDTTYDEFPNKNPQYGDVTMVTKDGTPQGELQEVYEWDGFEWVLVSAEFNIAFAYNKGYNPADTLYPDPTIMVVDYTNHIVKAKFPKSISERVEIKHVTELLKCFDGGPYVVSSFKQEINEDTPQQVNIVNKFKSGATSLNIAVAPSEDSRSKMRDFFIKGNVWGYIYMLDCKSLHMEGNTFTSNIDLSSIAGNTIVKNNNLFSNLYLSIEPDADEIIDIEVSDNGVMKETLEVRCSSGFYPTPPDDDRVRVNLKLNGNQWYYDRNYSTTELNLANLDLQSWEMKDNDLSQVHNSHFQWLAFKSQEDCDNFFMAVYNQGFGSMNEGKEIKDLTADFFANQFQGAINASGTIVASTQQMGYVRFFDGNSPTKIIKISGIGGVTGINNTRIIHTYANEPVIGSPMRNRYTYYSSNDHITLHAYSSYDSWVAFVFKSDGDTPWDWTDTLKIEDISDVVEQYLVIENCNFTPSEEILDLFKQRKVIVEIY